MRVASSKTLQNLAPCQTPTSLVCRCHLPHRLLPPSRLPLFHSLCWSLKPASQEKKEGRKKKNDPTLPPFHSLHTVPPQHSCVCERVSESGGGFGEIIESSVEDRARLQTKCSPEICSLLHSLLTFFFSFFRPLHFLCTEFHNSPQNSGG